MKKKSNNKKAMGIEDVGMIAYRVIFLAFTAFIFVMFMNLLLTPASFPNDAEAEMLLSRVLYSEAIHYKNPDINSKDLGRVYTNIIDFDKLNKLKRNNQLEDYFKSQFYHKTRDNLLVFKLTLTADNPNTGKPVPFEFISNKDQFMLLYPKKNFEGKGAVTALQRVYNTKCLIDADIVPCKVELLVLKPNT